MSTDRTTARLLAQLGPRTDAPPRDPSTPPADPQSATARLVARLHGEAPNADTEASMDPPRGEVSRLARLLREELDEDWDRGDLEDALDGLEVTDPALRSAVAASFVTGGKSNRPKAPGGKIRHGSGGGDGPEKPQTAMSSLVAQLNGWGG